MIQMRIFQREYIVRSDGMGFNVVHCEDFPVCCISELQRLYRQTSRITGPYRIVDLFKTPGRGENIIEVK